MGAFLKDQNGNFPITFYGALFIAGMVSIGIVVSRAPTHSIRPGSDIRIHASAKPCSELVLATRYGRQNCVNSKSSINGSTIVFLKAKSN